MTTTALPNLRDKLLEIAGRMQSVSLEELEKITLLQRHDMKYALLESKLPDVLSDMVPYYRVLQVQGHRMVMYESLYYDTDNLQCYLDHHNGKATRDKVRFRRYVETGGVYFELKHKSNKSKTEKSRLEVAQIEQDISSEGHRLLEFLPISSDQLKPKIFVYFNRITLASEDLTERLTIDTQIRCTDGISEKSFPGLAIVEVKQDRMYRYSPIVHIMQKRRLLPGSISKYCLCIHALNPNIKYNYFKPFLRRLNKMLYGHSQYP